MKSILNKQVKLIFKIILIGIVVGVFSLGKIVFFPHELPKSNYELLINKEESLNGIAKGLKRDGLISSQRIFLHLLRILNKDRKVTAGLYILKSPISMWDLIKRISSGKPDEISITLIDGWTVDDIRNYVDGLPYVRHLTQNLSNNELKHELKISWPSLEGAFYPSTYYIAPNETDLEIYKNAHAIMRSKLESVYAKRNLELNVDNPYELLILASLVEKETAKPQDMQIISTVFNNRLRIGMRLQTDPAVFYGLTDKGLRDKKLRGKEKITRADYKIDTKYNTYLHAGLPPTPICSPSLTALEAAANPSNDKNVLYFVAVGLGKTRFSESFSVHSRLVAKYLKRQSTKCLTKNTNLATRENF